MRKASERSALNSALSGASEIASFAYIALAGGGNYWLFTTQLCALDLLAGQNYGQIMLISATEFKATCLELMDRVQQTGEEITITKHGKPLAKLAPIEPVHKAPGELFGCAKARLTILGDIVAPVEELVWNADEENVLRP